MRQWTNTTTAGAARAITPSPTYINAISGGFYVWCATARDLTDGSNVVNTITSEMQRTATTCYMRGVSERIDVQSSSALPWKWRRICFTLKDPSAFASGTGATIAYPGYIESSDGYTRTWVNAFVNNDTTATARLQEIMFHGRANTDWDEPMMAKIDTRRVDLKYDKTRLIQSGNDTGVFKKYPHWHSMNKNLVYDDEENGDVMQASNFSVTDKRGMGDYLIVDIFQAHGTGSETDILRVQSETCLYWHEK